MKDRRFGRVLRWVRDVQRISANYVRNNEGSECMRWHVTKERGRTEAFQAMLLVMEAETRKHQRESRKKAK